jgi:hypothetical protein
MKVCRWHFILVAVLAVFVIFAQANADNYSDTLNVFKNSPMVKPFFENAYGYAIFPLIGKGAMGVGGAFGKGQVYKGGEITGTTSLVKVSVGFQLGGKGFSEIIFFQDKRAYDEFTGGTFELDATASAVAVTAGAEIQAGTAGATAGASLGPAAGTQAKTEYRKGMAIFVHTIGGFMYEASIGGQKFIFEPKRKANP